MVWRIIGDPEFNPFISLKIHTNTKTNTNTNTNVNTNTKRMREDNCVTQNSQRHGLADHW